MEAYVKNQRSNNTQVCYRLDMDQNNVNYYDQEMKTRANHIITYVATITGKSVPTISATTETLNMDKTTRNAISTVLHTTTGMYEDGDSIYL